MLSREKANEYLKEQIEKNGAAHKWGTNISLACYKAHKIPVNIVTGVCSKLANVSSINDFVLFSIINVIDYKKIPEFFTELEIKQYGREQYNNNVTIPKEFKVVQIAPDQWLGRIRVNDWMTLRDLQLINYNENTQRPFKKIIRGEEVTYKMDIDKVQVNNIYTSIMNGSYIPDTITLNLPEDAVYFYNDEECTLTIESYDHFDITDGMHRYLAFSKADSTGKKFSDDYYEELRITVFNTKKAENFIYQQDQKHRMSKLVAKSFDPNSVGNFISSKLNTDIDSLVKGMISKNDNLINEITLSNTINQLYKIPNSLSEEFARKRYKLETYKKIKSYFDYVVENDLTLLENKWSDLYVVSLISASKYNVPFTRLTEYMQKSLTYEDKLSKNVTAKNIAAIYERGEEYV